MTSQRVGRGSSAGCPNFLSEPYSKADYARTVVCFVGLLATAVKLCIFRRRTAAGKKLLGLPYLLALFLFIMFVLLPFWHTPTVYIVLTRPSAFGLGLIAGTLRECDQISYDDYYKVNIALSVLNGIGFWLLLVVIVWTLNSMLREHLGHRLKASKAVCLAIVVLMGLFSFVVTVLRCYLQWLATTDGLYSGRPVFITEYQYISLVFWVLYLASVLISGVFALLAVRAMRSKQVFGGVSSLVLICCTLLIETGIPIVGRCSTCFCEHLVSHFRHAKCKERYL
jgi:hypothetical protein